MQGRKFLVTPSAIATQRGEELDLWEVAQSLLLPANVTALALSADGLILALGYLDGRIELMHLDKGARRLAALGVHHGGWAVSALAFSADGHYLASSAREAPRSGVTGREDETICIWDCLDTAQPPHYLDYNSDRTEFPISCLAFSIDGHILAVGQVFGNVALWQWEQNVRVHTRMFDGVVDRIVFDGPKEFRVMLTNEVTWTA